MSRSISCKVLSVVGLMAMAEAGLSIDEGRAAHFLGTVGGLVVVVVVVFLLKVSTDELRLSFSFSASVDSRSNRTEPFLDALCDL